MPRPARRAVVIGSGLAGLSAAFALVERGWHVDVLEAQDRFGGRVLSTHFNRAPHLVCELGGEWIGADHHRVRRLCRQFKLSLQQHRYSTFFWNGHERSKLYGPTAEPLGQASSRRYDRFLRAVRKDDHTQLKALDAIDWWTQLQLLHFTEPELTCRSLGDSTDFGESIRMVSAYVAAAEYAASDATDEVDSKIRGGNGQLITALAERVGLRRVHRRATVVAVRQDDRGVYVTAAMAGRGRRVFSADACVCAIPAHRLRKIRWSPPLPQAHADAALELQYSRIMKTAILFDERFWPSYKRSGFSVSTTGVSDWCFDSTYRQRGTAGILCSYAVGDKADDLASETDENLVKWIGQDVLHSQGKRGPLPNWQVRRQAWQMDPWTGGAYALYRPGQWFRVRPVLQQPHIRVQFAGEHLAECQGFMEGAVETGQAAAQRIF